MSGHSKWASIKHKKGATDKKRGQLFSKLSRAIMVAVKEGGPNVADNLALQNAVQKARDFSMPQGQHRACDRAGVGVQPTGRPSRPSSTRATARAARRSWSRR